MTETELPWTIRGGFVVCGSFATVRERQLAEAVNRSMSAELERVSLEEYRRGREDGRALYEPRTWLGRFFG